MQIAFWWLKAKNHKWFGNQLLLLSNFRNFAGVMGGGKRIIQTSVSQKQLMKTFYYDSRIWEHNCKNWKLANYQFYPPLHHLRCLWKCMNFLQTNSLASHKNNVEGYYFLLLTSCFCMWLWLTPDPTSQLMRRRV